MNKISRKDAKTQGLKRYYTGKPCLRGHVSERYVSGGRCYTCNLKGAGAYYHQNKEDVCAKKALAYKKDPTKRLACTASWRKDHFLKHRFSILRSGATDRKKEFTLTFDDLVFPENCPALGIKLDYHKRGRGAAFNSPTVDRIDSTKGYIPGNVIVVSHLANRIKSNATPEQITKVAEFYSNLQSSQNRALL